MPNSNAMFPLWHLSWCGGHMTGPPPRWMHCMFARGCQCCDHVTPLWPSHSPAWCAQSNGRAALTLKSARPACLPICLPPGQHTPVLLSACIHMDLSPVLSRLYGQHNQLFWEAGPCSPVLASWKGLFPSDNWGTQFLKYQLSLCIEQKTNRNSEESQPKFSPSFVFILKEESCLIWYQIAGFSEPTLLAFSQCF